MGEQRLVTTAKNLCANNYAFGHIDRWEYDGHEIAGAQRTLESQTVTLILRGREQEVSVPPDQEWSASIGSSATFPHSL